eukprot:CAMPEP_0202687852 /NCGR_PEP_ID=MMETSP1385-20130828/3438_1 /ASSEMBLY_ACC=CAM_ASM_000861 /TAXON_ID=933848 /ORGANISM="Elphidium margaritaceum" /LENGTH=173 /DNA_ID=CAMNT_0049342703 /DNA_START=21 /DNA_END=542 /DNA_ORIENTATION=+
MAVAASQSNSQSNSTTHSVESNIQQTFIDHYDDKIAQKAVSVYKQMYNETEKEKELKMIESDVLGKSDDPTQCKLYTAILQSLQSDGQFKTDKDKNALYDMLLSAVSAALLSYNQPWNPQNHKAKPKKRQSTKETVILQQFELESNEQTIPDVLEEDDEKYGDQDNEDLSDLE